MRGESADPIGKVHQFFVDLEDLTVFDENRMAAVLGQGSGVGGIGGIDGFKCVRYNRVCHVVAVPYISASWNALVLFVGLLTPIAFSMALTADRTPSSLRIFRDMVWTRSFIPGSSVILTKESARTLTSICSGFIGAGPRPSSAMRAPQSIWSKPKGMAMLGIP